MTPNSMNQGLLATLMDLGDGSSSLQFDDVRRVEQPDGTDWRVENLFTRTQYGNELLEQLELTPEQYQEIGENLVIRLLAQQRRVR